MVGYVVYWWNESVEFTLKIKGKWDSYVKNETSGLSDECAHAGLVLLVRKERFLKIRPSILLFIYIGVMLLILLLSRLAMIVGNIFNYNMDNVYTFAAMIKYRIAASPSLLFCFSVKLLTFCTSSCLSTIRFLLLSLPLTVTLIMWRRRYLCCCHLHTLSAFLIFLKFEMKNYPQFCLCIIMAV